ncbi:hypothetical protein, partial [Rossellomorea marisflavi]|uniref:hypothetical protein n=1 Tax=Rossellomorea marisflavi TaxID=189381 RepID=UPI003CF756DF
ACSPRLVLIEKCGEEMCPFRSAAAVRFPRGVVRASSCLRDLSRTLFPSESAVLRCTALFGKDMVSDSGRMFTTPCFN